MLEQINDHISCTRHELKMPGVGFYFNCRMSIIRSSTGGVILHSPVPISDEQAAAIDAIGPVEHIIAPNCYHHMFAGPARERYPDAKLWGAPGLAAKRADLSFDAELDPANLGALSEDFEAVMIEGIPEFNEIVFFHRPSGALIMTDLLFNIYEARGFLSPWVFRMVGAWQKLAQSKLWRRFTQDREAAGRSIERVLEWEFSSLIVAHGRVVTGENTREQVREALWWMRGE